MQLHRSTKHHVFFPLRIIAVFCLVAFFFAIVNEFIGAGQRLLLTDAGANDFLGLYSAATLVDKHAGVHMYDLARQLSTQRAVAPVMTKKHGFLPFFSPPFFALFLWPLAWVPILPAYAMWTLFNAGLFVFICYLSLWEIGGKRSSWKNLVFVMGELIFLPFLTTLLIGQISFIITLLFLVTWMLLKRRREFLAGLVFCLVFIKPQFILLPLVVFVIQRRYRVVGGILFGCAVLSFVSVLLIGWQGIINFVSLLLHAADWGSQYGIEINVQHSLQTALMILFRVQSPSDVRGLWMIGVLIVGIMTCVVWLRRYSFKSLEFGLQWILLLVATLLTSPHTHSHDLTLLAVAAVVCMYIAYAAPKRLQKRFYLFLIVCYIIFEVGSFLDISTHARFRSFWLLVSVGTMVCLFFAIFFYFARGRFGMLRRGAGK